MLSLSIFLRTDRDVSLICAGMSAAASTGCARGRQTPTSVDDQCRRRRRRSTQTKAQTETRSSSLLAPSASHRRPVAIPRAAGGSGRGGSNGGGGPEDWLERIKQGEEREKRRRRRRKKRRSTTSAGGGKLSFSSFQPPTPRRAHALPSRHLYCDRNRKQSNKSISTGIPEVEAPDYNSDSSPPPPSSSRPRTPGTTPLGARPRRGAGGSASSFSSLSSYSSDDEARASVRRQERVLLDAWTGVGGEGDGTESGKVLPAASVPVVGGFSALLLALLVAAGPPS